MVVEIGVGVQVDGTEWTILGIDSGASRRFERKMYRCRCSCGDESTVSGRSLRNGTSRGCRKCSYKRSRQVRMDTLERIRAEKEDRPDGPGTYLPSEEVILSECRKIREEKGHVFG